MKIKWNNCFLCLNDLNSPLGEKSAGKRKINPQVLKLLFKYLLDTHDHTYGHLLQEISQVLECNGNLEGVAVSSASPKIQFCVNCEQLTNRISKLHLELEIAQMKLINELKAVKHIVVTNSKAYGENEGAKIGLEVFEDWLKDQEKKGIQNQNERKMLDTLYAFQTAVFEKGKYSVEIPCIYVKKYSYIEQPPVVSSTVSNAIKTEPLDLDHDTTVLDQNFANSDDEMGFDGPIEMGYEADTNLDTNSSQTQKRKRKSKSDSKPSKIAIVHSKKSSKTRMASKFKIEAEVKNETPIAEEDFIFNKDTQESADISSIKTEDDKYAGKRKTRAAANLASKRIYEIKHEQAQYNRRDKKSAVKRKKIAEPSKLKPSKAVRTPESSDTESSTNDESVLPLKGKRGRKNSTLPTFASRSKQKGNQKNRHRPMYSCDTENCGFTTINSYKFEQHLRDHETDDKMFTCNKCSDMRSFSGKQHYDFHMAAHDGYNKIRCDFCSKHFSAIELYDHMKTHTDKLFPCRNCSYCSSSREKYLVHLMVHGRQAKLWCDLCNCLFRSRHRLLTHLYEIHKAIEKAVCNVEGCDKSFVDLKNLKLHQKVHTHPFACTMCDKQYNNVHRLKRHQILHTGEKPFKCEHCPVSYAHKSNLDRHIVREHEGKKFKCDKCPNEYSCKQSLLVHVAIHDGTGLSCGHPGCDKKFGNRSLWRRHQLVHTDEKNHMCEECGMQLKSRQQWKKHMLIHIGDKKFKCQYCDKAFVQKKYLDNHVRIHTGEKPFVCDVCGNAFNQYAALYMHKRKHLGAAAPPVNNATGRPRLKEQKRMKVKTDTPHASFLFPRIPPEAACVRSVGSSSIDNESVHSHNSSGTEGPSLATNIKLELPIGIGRERDDDTDFSATTGFTQQHLQSLGQSVGSGMSYPSLYNSLLQQQHASTSNFNSASS